MWKVQTLQAFPGTAKYAASPVSQNETLTPDARAADATEKALRYAFWCFKAQPVNFMTRFAVRDIDQL